MDLFDERNHTTKGTIIPVAASAMMAGVGAWVATEIRHAWRFADMNARLVSQEAQLKAGTDDRYKGEDAGKDFLFRDFRLDAQERRMDDFERRIRAIELEHKNARDGVD